MSQNTRNRLPFALHRVALGFSLAVFGAVASGQSSSIACPTSLPSVQSPQGEAVASLEQALSAQASGQWQRAMDSTRHALSTQPGSVHWQLLYSALLIQSGDWRAARCALQTMAQNFPELGAVHNNLAVVHAAQGDWHLAAQSLEDALRADPKYALAAENLAEAHLQLAEQALEQAQEMTPNNGEIKQRLAAVRALLAATPRQEVIPAGIRPSAAAVAPLKPTSR